MRTTPRRATSVIAAGNRILRSDPAPLPPAPVLAAFATFFAAADLARASFVGGSLSDVTFHGANLAGTRFENVRFFSTDFSRANLQGARLAGLDLLLVTNLHLSTGGSIDLSNSRVCECVVDAMGDRFLGQPNVVMCGADLCP